MNWSEWFTPDKIEGFASWLASIIVTIYVVCKTIKTKLDAYEKKERKVPSFIKQQVNSDREIQTEMEKVKELLNADRVQIYDFHNGGHYANGRSALKIDCTYEVCRYGVSAQYSKLQDIPISCIPRFVNSLLMNKEMRVKDIEELKDKMPSTYEMKKSMGIISFYDVLINNEQGEPIGFVDVQFCNNQNYNVQEDAVKRLAWFIEGKLQQNTPEK